MPLFVAGKKFGPRAKKCKMQFHRFCPQIKENNPLKCFYFPLFPIFLGTHTNFSISHVVLCSFSHSFMALEFSFLTGVGIIIKLLENNTCVSPNYNLLFCD